VLGIEIFVVIAFKKSQNKKKPHHGKPRWGLSF
jgi:hypothetical protein